MLDTVGTWIMEMGQDIATTLLNDFNTNSVHGAKASNSFHGIISFLPSD
jgi:hypothetical protein